MKDLIKKIVKGMIRMARNLFYRRFYRKQIRREFLEPSDSLSKEYREEINRYWRGYGVRINTAWHKWYSSRNGKRDMRYIPEDLYYCRIEPALNKQEFSVPLADKSIFDLLMPDFKRPRTIIRNVNGIFLGSDYELMTREDAVLACCGLGEVAIKPTIDTGGGRRVGFVVPDDGADAASTLNDLFVKYNKDFIVQESIRQHEGLEKLNSASVNTLKIMSFLKKDGVSIVSTIVRVGLEGQRVDNLTTGGYCLGVDEGGNFRETGFTKNGEPVSVLPNGYVFKGKRVPGYHNATERVKRAHLKLGQFRFVSWDIVIDPDETPIMIEYNLFYQGINLQQLSNGPLFGDMTDEVLDFVFKK